MEDHKLISREVITRKQADDLLFTLADTDQASLNLALDWAEASDLPLSLVDCTAELNKLARTKGLSLTAPGTLLGALFSIEGLRAGLGWTGDALVDFFLKASPPKEPRPLTAEEIQKLESALKRLFALGEKFDATRKAQKIYDGLLPIFRSCRSLVEIRPVFSSDASRITGHIIAATLAVDTYTVEPENELTETHSFQVDVTDVDKMIAELSRLKQKISSICDAGVQLGTLLNPKKSLVCQ